MIVLSDKESLRHFNLGNDWCLEASLQFCCDLNSCFHLVFINAPYAAPILSAEVWTLAVYLGGIVHFKESEQ